MALPVTIGRSACLTLGRFTGRSLSRDLDLLYDLLCLSRSRSKSLCRSTSLSRSLDFPLSVDLLISETSNIISRKKINTSCKKRYSNLRLLSLDLLLLRSRSLSRDLSRRRLGDGDRLRPIALYTLITLFNTTINRQTFDAQVVVYVAQCQTVYTVQQYNSCVQTGLEDRGLCSLPSASLPRGLILNSSICSLLFAAVMLCTPTPCVDKFYL